MFTLVAPSYRMGAWQQPLDHEKCWLTETFFREY